MITVLVISSVLLWVSSIVLWMLTCELCKQAVIGLEIEENNIEIIQNMRRCIEAMKDKR